MSQNVFEHIHLEMEGSPRQKWQKAQSIGHYIVSKKKECQKSMEFIAYLEAFYSDKQAWAELLFYQHNVKTFVISLLRKEWSFICWKKRGKK